jgi:hypothetical protein
LSRKEVTSVIVGPRTAEQLEAYLPAVFLAIPSEMIDQLSVASRPTQGDTDGRQRSGSAMPAGFRAFQPATRNS